MKRPRIPALWNQRSMNTVPFPVPEQPLHGRQTERRITVMKITQGDRRSERA